MDKFIEECVCKSSISVIEAMKKIQDNAKGVLYIIDENNISSIRGVEKAGFKRYASGEKRFGLYMVNRKDNKNETTSL